MTTDVVHTSSRTESLRLPGILLGLGLGGFVDGIVLHQILQWHHMLSSEGSYPKTTVAGLEANTLADGLFHASTWILATVGVWLLWRTAREHRGVGPGRVLAGWMLLGWGVFNVAEGIVDHHLLGIHHVREGANQTAWDLAFLAFGALLLIGGRLLTRERDDELAEGEVVDLGTARHASDRGHGRRTTRPDTSERAGRR